MTNLYDEEERLIHELYLIEEKIDDLMYDDWLSIPSIVSRVESLRREWREKRKELEVVQRCIVDKESME